MRTLFKGPDDAVWLYGCKATGLAADAMRKLQLGVEPPDEEQRAWDGWMVQQMISQDEWVVEALQAWREGKWE